MYVVLVQWKLASEAGVTGHKCMEVSSNITEVGFGILVMLNWNQVVCQHVTKIKPIVSTTTPQRHFPAGGYLSFLLSQINQGINKVFFIQAASHGLFFPSPDHSL